VGQAPRLRPYYLTLLVTPLAVGHRDGAEHSDGSRRHNHPESEALRFVSTDLTTDASLPDV